MPSAVPEEAEVRVRAAAGSQRGFPLGRGAGRAPLRGGLASGAGRSPSSALAPLAPVGTTATTTAPAGPDIPGARLSPAPGRRGEG